MTSGDGQFALEGKLELLVDASATLLGSLNEEELLPRVLDLARKLNAAEACAIWRHDEAEGVWRITSAVGLSPEFKGVPAKPATVLDIAAKPYCFERVEEAPVADGRRKVYAAEGIRSLVAMPMRLGGKNCATLAFYYRSHHEFSETELRVASALTNLAAAAVETAELVQKQQRHRAELEHARARSSFLAEASAVLSSSLDYEATLAAVARLAVPHMADWCQVEVMQADGTLKPLAIAHADPAKAEWARQMKQRYPTDPNAPGGPASVVRSGHSSIRPVVTDAMLARVTGDEGHLAMLRSLGFTSYMCVPLAARDRVLGTMTFVSADPEKHFDSDDLTLAEDLARRAAMAMDNALLYASAQRERVAMETALVALRENEERLLLALDAGRMGIWDWDIRTHELNWTDNLVAMHGFEPGAFDGTFESFVGVIHPEDRPMFLGAVERAIKEKSSFQTEMRVLFPDGSTHWLGGSGKVYCGPDGEPARMIGLGMDVTERHLLEEKLRGAQKLESIGVLAGGIAHDFNNLLTGILGNASLAKDMIPESSAAAPLMENVVHASERAADLTQQMLAYSGKGRFVIEPLNLSTLVREITNLVQATIPKMVRLDLNLDPHLPCIEADSSQVQQVIMNLTINGAEAMNGNAGTVLVKTGLENVDAQYIRDHHFSGDLQPGAYVFLEVQDNGCGMDGATQARIFDPFFTTKFTGRGLGLAAVSGIVRSHRGAIQVHSARGEGSKFRVLFPAVEAVASAQEPQPSGDLRGSGTILVIDDEEAVQKTAQAALRRYGYAVVVAANGAEGVALFEREPDRFAAVLLDLTMPVLGGEAALKLIHKIRPRIPVIASSGYSELEASRRFPPGEIAGFLQKPYTSARLAQKIKAALNPQMSYGQSNG